MPISKYFGGHGSEVMHNMTREYGAKKGKSVFYATANKRNQKPKSEETESADAQPVSESARDILQAIKTKNWHAANEAFSSAISQKIADRLALERKSIFKEESGCICKEPLNLTPDEWKRKSKDSKGVHRDANGKIAYRTCLRYCPVHGTTLAPVNIVKGTVKEAFEVPEPGDLVKDKIGHTYKILQVEAGGYRFLVDVGYDTPQGWRSANGKPVWMGRSELRLSESLASEPAEGDAIRELGSHEAEVKEEDENPFEEDWSPEARAAAQRERQQHRKQAPGTTSKKFGVDRKAAAANVRKARAKSTDIHKHNQDYRGSQERYYHAQTGTKPVNEEHMPTSEVQRVYDEVRDVPETELLCGIRQLKVNNKGDVVSYVSESIVREGIESITGARITKYRDNGQTIAYVDWKDSKGKTGTTQGDPNNAHMKALLDRAKREGVKVVSEAAVQTGFTKKAVIRDPSAPIGQPADMYLNCVCGNRVDMGKSTEYPGKGGTCSKCGQKYDSRGYMTEERVGAGDSREGWKTLKVIPSHSGLARWLAEVDPDGDGATAGWVKFPQGLIPSPYFYSRYRGVYNWNGKKVIRVETSHKRYEIIEVPKSEPILTHDPDNR